MLSESLHRVGYTQDDLNAYCHWCGVKYGQYEIIKDYYIKSRGFHKMSDFRDLFPKVRKDKI